jgi:phosphoenolpyruvate-protein kinase (PTS system EI component)
VLRLIRMTVQAAGDAGKPISACGEMAGTSACTPILLGLGLRHLSMAARRVPDVVTQIRRVRIDDCQQLVETMLAADDGAHAQRLLDQFHSTRRRS